MGNYLYKHKTKLHLEHPKHIDIYINNTDNVETLLIYTLNAIDIKYHNIIGRYYNKNNLYITYNNPRIYYNDILLDNKLIIYDIFKEYNNINFKIVYEIYDNSNRINNSNIINKNIFNRIKDMIFGYDNIYNRIKKYVRDYKFNINVIGYNIIDN